MRDDFRCDFEVNQESLTCFPRRRLDGIYPPYDKPGSTLDLIIGMKLTKAKKGGWKEQRLVEVAILALLAIPRRGHMDKRQRTHV